MGRIRSSFTWVFTIVLAILMQISFVFVDSKSSPTKTVVEFSKAYFIFEPKMNDYLCHDSYEENKDKNFTERYLETVSQRALELGFEVNSIRQSLFHVKTKTMNQNSNSAKIRMEASSRTYINPLFSWVSRIFDIGEVYHIDEVFELSKEDGIWKISSNPFEHY